MAVSEETMRKLLKLFAEDGSEEEAELVMRRLMRTAEEKRGPQGTLTEQAEQLKAAYEVFGKRCTFSAGQLVQGKRGMKNRRRPLTGQPAIVLEVLPTPVLDTNPADSSAATPYFREPLDLVLGLLDSDGDFLIFYYDSRRFEQFQPLK